MQQQPGTSFTGGWPKYTVEASDMLPHLSHTARNMLESQRPAEPLFCLSLLFVFQLSQVSETAQMKIYSKRKQRK